MLSGTYKPVIPDSELDRGLSPWANTKSKEVNLTKRVQTRKGLRYCPVVLSPNGRVKPDWVIINGQQERHPAGAYYVEWRQNGRRMRRSVGSDAQDAIAKRQRKQAELNAVNNGVPIVPSNGRRSLAETVADYLEEIEFTKKSKTHAAYRLCRLQWHDVVL